MFLINLYSQMLTTNIFFLFWPCCEIKKTETGSLFVRGVAERVEWETWPISSAFFFFACSFVCAETETVAVKRRRQQQQIHRRRRMEEEAAAAAAAREREAEIEKAIRARVADFEKQAE
jgi:hypothetical protein